MTGIHENLTTMSLITDDDYAQYITAVKETASRLGETAVSASILRDIGAYVLDFLEGDDRSTGLLAGIALEEATRELLESYLVDDRTSRKQFERGEALGSHLSRIRLSFALGLLPEWIRDELLTLREIRNACAHERARWFSKRPLSQKVERLRLASSLDAAVAEGSISADTLRSHKVRFLLSAGVVWALLRVWSGVLRDDFRCAPLARLKRSELSRLRRRPGA